ncbi:two-partner secretion domain-containing protein [Peristeroidobacter soli]|uniref:two-partner secretion domain-containing protein n=1 Tax=Peristeroidobacter soli TaxID=2497877 RepID=UPI00101C82E8|nr:filamentous hemagglutinin N-terminal domain-containing protein [Peristeroidobacter soli]
MNKKVFALTPLALACKCVLAQAAPPVLPAGGAIVQGQGSIAISGDTLTVNQSSQRMIADWQSFSIGSDNTVRFAQPSADAVALNRVVGGDPSRILGNLSANGRVYIQNPNGVLFAKGAQVNVGSLVATTLQADAKEFMETGGLKLSGAQGAGTVSNEGTINAAPGGHVVLAGPNVNNAGSINAPGGTLALAAAGAVTVDPTGAGVVSIDVSAEAVGAQLVNSGVLTADGGRINLQAAAVNAAASHVLQIDGIVRARSIEGHDGEIVLSGGASGLVSVGGQLDASGEGTNGGTVKVLGDRVLLQNTAQIDAAGTNGGRVLVGGAFQGQGSEPNARVTVVEEGARIDASARDRGNGGDVVVWSDDVTSYAGNIAARGGASGGDGGSVEVSGKRTLLFTGAVDTQAPAGKRGTLLLDPEDIDIGETANVDGVGPTGDDLLGTTLLEDDYLYAESSITASNVASLLATTDVTLQAGYSVTVSAPLSVAPGGADSTLTINTPHAFINAPVTLNNASLNIDTQRLFSDSIRVNAPVQSLRSVALTSTDIGLAADVTVPSLTMRVPDDALIPGSIHQDAGSIDSSDVLTRATQGIVSLTQAGNTMATLDVTAYTASVDVDFTPDGSPLRTGATIGDAYTLNVGERVVQSRSMTIGGEFDVTTAGDAALDDPDNEFIGPVRFDIDGSLRLRDVNDLDAGGVARDDINIVAGGLFILGADISSTDASRQSLVEFSSAGFDNSADAHVNVQPGSRFIIRSSDFTRDVIGAIGFSADDIANVNYTVLNGWVGADPTTGNGYYTNRRGTIDAPNADRPPISWIYDRTTAFDFVQTGNQADAWLQQDAHGATGLSHYRVVTDGAFDDPTAGTNKRYTVDATNNVVATYADNGSTVYGLLYESFTRPAGEVGPEGPGNAISEIIPRPVYSNGVDAIDRAYDGTSTVALNIDAATLSGVLEGDTVGLAPGNLVGTMADPDAGIDKHVTTDGPLGLSGVDARNYVLTDLSTPTVTITAPPVLEVPHEPRSVSDPQQPFRNSISGRHDVRPANVDLEMSPLALPMAPPPVAAVEPVKQIVTDTRTYYVYFPYRSATIDEARSASELSSLLQALGDGFEVQRVRGFTSPEGPRVPRYGFEGNDDLSYRRASAALAQLRKVCAEHGENCVPDSVQPEAGSELHTLVSSDTKGRSQEVEGEPLAEYAVAEFNSDNTDARQRTPEIERELEFARTPVAKAQIVYPQLRRVEIEVTRERAVEQTNVASTADPHSSSVHE